MGIYQTLPASSTQKRLSHSGTASLGVQSYPGQTETSKRPLRGETAIPFAALHFGEQSFAFPSWTQKSWATSSSSSSTELMDPATRKKLKQESAFSDRLLHYNAWQKAKLDAYNLFVALPRQVVRGLRGDPQYTFSSFLNVAQLPYYLGGAFLVLSFRFGRDKINVARQALGVMLYYLGITAANKGIDALYRVRSGVDLDQRYEKPNGDTDRVFGSINFSRKDLYKEKDYEEPLRKLGIPKDIADPHQEVREQMQQIASDGLVDKLLLGNLLAAVGAGYLARTDTVAHLLNDSTWRQLKLIWQAPKGGPKSCLSMQLGRTLQTLTAPFGTLWRQKVAGHADELTSQKIFRTSVLWGTGVLGASILIHALRSNTGAHRRYAPSGLTPPASANTPTVYATVSSSSPLIPSGSFVTTPAAAHAQFQGLAAPLEKSPSGNGVSQPAPPVLVKPTWPLVDGGALR